MSKLLEPVVVNDPLPCEIEVKRLYVPATITGKCPTCGAEIYRDFSGDYLSYVKTNEPFEVSIACHGCEEKVEGYSRESEATYSHRATVRLVLKLELA